MDHQEALQTHSALTSTAQIV